MKKLTTLLLATTLAGGMAAAVVPTAFAQGGNQQGAQQGTMMNQKGQMRGWHNDDMGRKGMMRGMMANRGSLFTAVCSPNGAERIGAIFGALEQRLNLTDAQKPLFDDLKTAALAAQADFAKTCPAPGANKSASIVDRMTERKDRLTAEIAALDAVTPKLEAFYNSLTDAQKALLQPHKARGWGQRDGKGPGNRMGPAQGQGNGPGPNAPATSN